MLLFAEIQHELGVVAELQHEFDIAKMQHEFDVAKIQHELVVEQSYRATT